MNEERRKDGSVMTVQSVVAKALFVGAGSLALISVSAGANFAHQAPATHKKTVVTVWSWFIAGTMNQAIKQFERTHPNVVVKYSYYNYSPQFLTALKAAAASNTLPDIIGLQPGSLTQQYRPYLAPLNTRAKKTWGPKWESKIFPVDRAQMLMGNPPGNHNVYMLPQESQVICLWYNTKIFAALHLRVPRTLPALVHVANVLSAHGYMPLYQGVAGAWQNENVYEMIADQIAPGLFHRAQQGQAAWTSPGLVQAMKVWQALFTRHVFQAGALGDQAYPTGAQLFADGRVGMMALGSWWLQEAKYAPPIPPLVQGMKGFAPFFFPAVTAKGHVSPPVGGIDVGDGLTRNGARNPAAWQFLASLVNGAGEQASLNALNDLPAFKGFAPTVPVSPHIARMYRAFIAELSHAQNQRFAYPPIETAFDNAIAGVAAGKLTPVGALKQVQAATKQALAK